MEENKSQSDVVIYDVDDDDDDEDDDDDDDDDDWWWSISPKRLIARPRETIWFVVWRPGAQDDCLLALGCP